MTFISFDSRGTTGQLVCDHPQCDVVSRSYRTYMDGRDFPDGWTQTTLFTRQVGTVNHLCPEHAGLETARAVG